MANKVQDAAIALNLLYTPEDLRKALEDMKLFDDLVGHIHTENHQGLPPPSQAALAYLKEDRQNVVDALRMWSTLGAGILPPLDFSTQAQTDGGLVQTPATTPRDASVVALQAYQLPITASGTQPLGSKENPYLYANLMQHRTQTGGSYAHRTLRDKTLIPVGSYVRIAPQVNGKMFCYQVGEEAEQSIENFKACKRAVEVAKEKLANAVKSKNDNAAKIDTIADKHEVNKENKEKENKKLGASVKRARENEAAYERVKIAGRVDEAAAAEILLKEAKMHDEDKKKKTRREPEH